jgi:Asp/Glu/hydantoin racemase
MGNESSTMVDDSVPPQTLSARTLEAVAELIKEDRVKRIVVMTGAGISTAAGSMYKVPKKPSWQAGNRGGQANLATR